MTKQNKWDKINRIRERKRMDGPAPIYPKELNGLRRRITIEDFDFGYKKHILECFGTNRVDCYRVVSNNKLWKERIGWSRILEGIRKGLPRVGSPLRY